MNLSIASQNFIKKMEKRSNGPYIIEDPKSLLDDLLPNGDPERIYQACCSAGEEQDVLVKNKECLAYLRRIRQLGAILEGNKEEGQEKTHIRPEEYEAFQKIVNKLLELLERNNAIYPCAAYCFTHKIGRLLIDVNNKYQNNMSIYNSIYEAISGFIRSASADGLGNRVWNRKIGDQLIQLLDSLDKDISPRLYQKLKRCIESETYSSEHHGLM